MHRTYARHAGYRVHQRQEQKISSCHYPSTMIKKLTCGECNVKSYACQEYARANEHNTEIRHMFPAIHDTSRRNTGSLKRQPAWRYDHHTTTSTHHTAGDWERYVRIAIEHCRQRCSGNLIPSCRKVELWSNSLTTVTTSVEQFSWTKIAEHENVWT